MSMEGRTEAEWSDWWDEKSYTYTARLTRLGWAWEFLRRNPAFQDDLARAIDDAEWLKNWESLGVVDSRVDLVRWGVLFR